MRRKPKEGESVYRWTSVSSTSGSPPSTTVLIALASVPVLIGVQGLACFETEGLQVFEDLT